MLSRFHFLGTSPDIKIIYTHHTQGKTAKIRYICRCQEWQRKQGKFSEHILTATYSPKNITDIVWFGFSYWQYAPRRVSKKCLPRWLCRQKKPILELSNRKEIRLSVNTRRMFFANIRTLLRWQLLRVWIITVFKVCPYPYFLRHVLYSGNVRN